MKPAISPKFLDSLFAERQYDGLAWLSSLICGASDFDSRAPTYGLPEPLFLFVEGLAWFAQGIRSDVSTYFEATPTSRQDMMLDLLVANAPHGFAKRYALGMRTWKNAASIADLDRWLEASDLHNNAFLWDLAARNRATLDGLLS